MKELSPDAQELIARYQNWQKASQPQEGVITVHVDEVASRVASFYEKMRGIIDWREEHLLRKTAIERILKRRLFLKKEGEGIAEPLISELIRGGHFPNDLIPESKIAEVQRLINKYIFIIENAPSPPREKVKLHLYDWILGIAACELEETLAPAERRRETALMDYMLELMRERIVLKESIADQDTQIYVAIQRALFKLDPSLIGYNLLKKWYPDWTNLSPERLTQIPRQIYLIWEKIEKNLLHPLADKFYAVCERYDTPYLILGDIISENPTEAKNNLGNPEILEKKIQGAYQTRLKKVKGKLKRAAFYSTISIFLTKILVAFAIEVPFDKYLTGSFSYLTLGVNILIPPLLMAFLVLSIRPPSKQNESLSTMETMKIIYEREKKDVYEVRPSQKRGFILNSIIIITYFLGFLICFGLLIWGLQKLNFSLLSILIFIMFVSLISFAGAKIRQRAKELVVEKEREGFFHIFFDLFSIPILQVGKWLSGQWMKYNAIVIILNSLVDMPFQVFVEFLEQWRAFLKEKKEEIH